MRYLRIMAILTMIVLSFLFSGCQMEDVEPAKPTASADGLRAFEKANVESRLQSFTVTAETGGQVVGSKGSVLQFEANAFLTADNGPVTGDVKIEFIELFDRTSMLLARKPTVGKTIDGKRAVLVSGGEFYVNATQGGKQLKPAKEYAIIAPTANTGGDDNEMMLFIGTKDCMGDMCDVVWEQQDRKVGIDGFQDTGGYYSAYYAFQMHFGWTNIDRWYQDERPKTTLFVEVPKGYDNRNCAVYITYDGEPMALGKLDIFDPESRMFTEHYGLIPIGLKVHFVFVSIVEDEVHYAIQPATINENHIEYVTKLQEGTSNDLIAALNNLSH